MQHRGPIKRGGLPSITNQGQQQLQIPQKGKETVFLYAIILLFYTCPPPSFHTASGADEEMMEIAWFHEPPVAAIENPTER